MSSQNHTAIDPSKHAASYSRYSSNMQREDSIADQQRKCREKAEQNGHVILPKLEFKDEAVSGTKRDREGLNALETAVKAGTVKTVYIHSLSRLSRETTITQTLIKDLVFNHDARIISFSEGLDTNDPTWKMNMSLNSMLHEQYLTDLAGNVFRGQEGIVLALHAVGDHCFGYTSEAIPGSETTGRGKNIKPKKQYVVDPKGSVWVIRIFNWFVYERQSIRWITKELNRLGASMDHRAREGSKWRHQYVSRLLKNRKYVGEWAWGKQKNVRDPLTGNIRKKNRPFEETEGWVRNFPHLQIVDNETFAKAQRILDQNRKTYTANRKKRKKGGKSTSNDSHPRHLLAQLIVCDQCGCSFKVSGAHGQYLACSGHLDGFCDCKTSLSRELAERLILDAIGKQMLTNPVWRAEVFRQTTEAWDALEAEVPSELKTARQNRDAVDRKIKRLLDCLEDGQEDPELKERLAQRRAEKQKLSDRIKRLESIEQARPPKPTEAWIDKKLGKLGGVLRENAPAAAYALRNLLDGKIVVTEAQHPASKRLHLQGRFTVKMGTIVRELVGAYDACKPSTELNPDELCEEFVIDFREEPLFLAQSEKAKKLYDQGIMNAQIAKKLGCNRSYVTKLLKYWFESRGQEMPDGRSRRATLTQKQMEPPRYQAIADKVMTLADQKMLLQEIAEELDIDRNTVTSAIKWWHESRGLPVPDGRTRRKELDRKCG